MAQKAVHINGFYTNNAILDYAIHSDHIKAYMYFTACLMKENMWEKKNTKAGFEMFTSTGTAVPPTCCTMLSPFVL